MMIGGGTGICSEFGCAVTPLSFLLKLTLVCRRYGPCIDAACVEVLNIYLLCSFHVDSDGCDAVILGRRKDVIEASAAKLCKETGRTCIGVSADVRDPKALKEAVRQGVEKFGRIDYVICGPFSLA